VEPGERDGDLRVTDLVEKPSAADAPSDLAVIGRYVLPGSVFAAIAATPPGRGGEIQLTDALAAMAREEPIVGLVLDEPRHDVGDRLGFLKASVEFAARRDDVGPELVAWLRERFTGPLS
jgi:UTP--glucose-1-phosphate uridylyltransferase